MNDCVFCNVIRDPAAETNALVFKNDRYGIMMDKYPIERGHLMVFPIEHNPDVFLLEHSLLSEMILVAAEIAIAMKGIYQTQRIALFTAGQEIKDHGHIHVMPLRNGLKITFSRLKDLQRDPVPVSDLLSEGNRILDQTSLRGVTFT